jgi:hypothetical protein
LEEPSSYIDGNTPVILTHNYLFSRIELALAKQSLTTHLMFPTFKKYEKILKAYSDQAITAVSDKTKHVDWRAKTLLLRLHYDYLQHKILSLEEF